VEWAKGANKHVSDHLKAAVTRSSFHLMPVRQLDSVLREGGYSPSPAKTDFVRERDKRIVASQAVEDSFKRQARRQKTGQNNSGTVVSAFDVLVDKKVLGQVHHFKEPRVDDSVVLGRGLYMPDEAFRPRLMRPSVPLSEIVGTSDSVPWYNPTAKAVPAEHADHALFAAVKGQQQLDKIANLALFNCLLKQDTQLVCRKKAKGAELPGPWLFSLGEIPNSACIAWRARSVVSPKYSRQAFIPECDLANLKATDGSIKMDWIIILDLLEWEALPVRWLAPMERWLLPAPMSDQESGGLVALAESELEPLHYIAARRAFWAMPRYQLNKFAHHLKIRIMDGFDDLNACFALIQGILKCTDEECMEIMRARMAAFLRRTNGTCRNEFMKLEEGLDIFDKKSKEKGNIKQRIKKTKDYQKVHGRTPRAAPHTHTLRHTTHHTHTHTHTREVVLHPSSSAIRLHGDLFPST
jgi:hypothetical protein